MRKIKMIILFTFLMSSHVKAQKTDTFNIEMEKHSISANILGSSSLIGITYERILSKKIVFEVGIGIAGVGTGITFYPLNIKKSEFCFYTGIKFSTVALVDVGRGYGGYIPLGVTFFSKNGFNFGLDFGPAIGFWENSGRDIIDYDATTIYDNSKNIYVYGNLKIGVRF